MFSPFRLKFVHHVQWCSFQAFQWIDQWNHTINSHIWIDNKCHASNREEPRSVCSTDRPNEFHHIELNTPLSTLLWFSVHVKSIAVNWKETKTKKKKTKAQGTRGSDFSGVSSAVDMCSHWSGCLVESGRRCDPHLTRRHSNSVCPRLFAGVPPFTPSLSVSVISVIGGGKADFCHILDLDPGLDLFVVNNGERMGWQCVWFYYFFCVGESLFRWKAKSRPRPLQYSGLPAGMFLSAVLTPREALREELISPSKLAVDKSQRWMKHEGCSEDPSRDNAPRCPAELPAGNACLDTLPLCRYFLRDSGRCIVVLFCCCY